MDTTGIVEFQVTTMALETVGKRTARSSLVRLMVPKPLGTALAVHSLGTTRTRAPRSTPEIY